LSYNPKPVELVWLDSGITNGGIETWTPVESQVDNMKLHTVHSMGYLVHESEDTYYIIQTFDPEDRTGINLTAIAKQNVKEFNHLRRR
jgi:hypothetical protein